MSFLDLQDKYFLITGINNKKSLAFVTAKTLITQGAKLILSVQNEKQLFFCKKNFPESPSFLCDVSQTSSIINLAKSIKDLNISLNGIFHSIAFARFRSENFHEVEFEDFQEALRISAFSFIELTRNLKISLHNEASIVTVSISNLRATSYGYMGPIKAMLNSSIDYLAKSLSKDSSIRVNAIAAGPLKTAASAGIPNYLANFSYAEQLTLRKQSLKTQEVANTACFLLSPSSSGINATSLTVDAGMNVNYFDEAIVNNFYKNFDFL